jgi:hypothetical protein
MNMLRGSKLSSTTYRAPALMGGPRSIKYWHPDVRGERRPRGETLATSVWSARPKYPSPPRSGNAFAAAVFVAIPGLLLLTALLWVLNSIRDALAL